MQTPPRSFPVDNNGYIDESYLDTLSRNTINVQPTTQQSSRPPPSIVTRGMSLRGENIISQVGRALDDVEDLEPLHSPNDDEMDDQTEDIDEFDRQIQTLMHDLQVAFFAIALPTLARWLGRRLSMWAWTSYIQWYYQPRISDEHDKKDKSSRR
ncbi:5614_t:CDS:2 [Ambispora leptoticha]|uniref:5614_t:CDS:1 n=1 Tax=Ambispora leptoticha TaxID=144679 RepID=A0A9N8WN96_9GLOM|nr:5614_t:CDS:2 [Ambispora leptoticha]